MKDIKIHAIKKVETKKIVVQSKKQKYDFVLLQSAIFSVRQLLADKVPHIAGIFAAFSILAYTSLIIAIAFCAIEERSSVYKKEKEIVVLQHSVITDTNLQGEKLAIISKDEIDTKNNVSFINRETTVTGLSMR
jgi:hypothetical protein